MARFRGSRVGKLSQSLGTGNEFELIGLFFAFGLLFVWFWLAMDIEDNLPRLWRGIKFIVGFIPSIDAPGLNAQLDNLMRVLVIAAIVAVVWLLVKYGHYLVYAALVLFGLYAIGASAGPLTVVVIVLVGAVVLAVRSGSSSSGSSGKKGGNDGGSE